MAKSPIPHQPLLLLPVQPHQLTFALDSINLRGMSSSEREKALTHLASLLLLAAGDTARGSDDDEH